MAAAGAAWVFCCVPVSAVAAVLGHGVGDSQHHRHAAIEGKPVFVVAVILEAILHLDRWPWPPRVVAPVAVVSWYFHLPPFRRRNAGHRYRSARLSLSGCRSRFRLPATKGTRSYRAQLGHSERIVCPFRHLLSASPHRSAGSVSIRQAAACRRPGRHVPGLA